MTGEDELTAVTDTDRIAGQHQRWGWLSLSLFLALGVLLEALHGLKVGYYLEHPIRRQQWTLAHAHGTLVALVHVAFAITIDCHRIRIPSRLPLCSWLLKLSVILLPGGFFLGGLGVSESDPGAGIWLVPLGGITLLIAVFVLFLSVGEARESSHASGGSDE